MTGRTHRWWRRSDGARLSLLVLALAAFAVVVLPGTTNAASARPGPPPVAAGREPVPTDTTPGGTPGSAPSTAPTTAPGSGPAPIEVSETDAAYNRRSLPSFFDGAQVVSFYGYPDVPVMGRLGAFADPAGAIEAVRAVAAEYDRLNGARDVIPALHLIVSVAQPTPMEDGSYLARLDREVIRSYVEATASGGVLLFLDIQVGWADPLREVRRYAWALREPHVHLALDPEFATRPMQAAPGQVIGALSADDVNRVQHYLGGIARSRLLPRKILVLHQFMDHMLEDTDRYDAVEDVEISVDMDGYGGPWPKLSKYDRYALGDYSERPAIKLFYGWDDPLIPVADLQALDTPPALVIYQ